MAIPNTARTRLISGLPGNISHDGPTRVTAILLNSATESNNVFGRAFTYADSSVETARAGGTGVFAGILIHPKAYAIDKNYASNWDQVELMTMGQVYVQLDAAGAVGDKVYFDATGKITPTAAGNTLIIGASISRHVHSAEIPRLAVITLNGFQPV